MTRRTGEPPHHNTLYCYTDYGCRLPDCVERKNQWQRETRRRQRAGQPPLVDATPVRQHIQTLQAAGISTYRIALHAGVNDWTVRHFLPSKNKTRPRKHSTSPDIARRILAVTIETTTSGYTDSTGTLRRIQALAAAGWPIISMAGPLSLHPRYVSDLLRRGDRPVYTTTAEKVARGYDLLKDRRPSKSRRVNPQASTRIRAVAAANRWPTPKYWADRMDVIDDPHFTPEYGITRGELLATDGRELLSYGVHIDQAAARLGVTRNHLQQELLRHPDTEQELAA